MGTTNKLGLGLWFAGTLIVMTAQAASKPTSEDFDARFASCASVLEGGTKIGRYEFLNQKWGLEDLLNPDPAQNLAYRFPTILMNADQRNWYVGAVKYPPYRVKDPAYRIRSHFYFPLISAGVPEAGGHQIIGHYDTIQRAMEYIKSRAQGKRAGKMVGFLGPAGTGKTELLNLLDRASSILAMTDPDYFQLTFEFFNLKEIPELQPMVYGVADDGHNPTIRDISLNRSPLVLLPPGLQEKVIALGAPKVREKLGMDPLPFRAPTGKTQRVIDAIIRHYAKQENLTGGITERDYLRFLSRHVRIVRKTFESQQPTQIIRYLGKHPNMEGLFFNENMALSQFYGPKDPLSYNYGEIPGADGRGLYIDEMFRQSGEVRDTMLDLSQNNVAKHSSAPAETLDVTLMFATNDESVEQAMQDGGAKAHLNRTVRLPMRNAIEPLFVIKIALNDVGRSKFLMRSVDQIPDRLSGEADSAATSSAEVITYDPQKVFPDTTDGAPVGSDGRYALYYKPSSGEKPVLIAPRSLLLLGLTAAGTSLVTDAQRYEKANEKQVEFHTFQKYRHYFVDDAIRLKVLMGEEQPENRVASELLKARFLLKEGENGIGAREVENWLTTALAMAVNDNGGVLTPAIMDLAFRKLMDDGNITATAKDRTRWISVHNKVKAKFILPALASDVVNILQGQGRTEAMYDDIKRELLALSTDREADYVEGEGGKKAPIDRKRLAAIYAIFRELTGQDFDPGMLKDFHFALSETSTTKRHPQLMAAVRQYLMQLELDKTTISELLQYFEGRRTSEQVRLRGQQAEAQLERYGYDRVSFIQALAFIRDQQFELDKQANR